MNATRITLPIFVRNNAVRILKVTVANRYDLYLRARLEQANWNLRGGTSMAVGRLLREFAITVHEHVVDEAVKPANALAGLAENMRPESGRQHNLKPKRDPPRKPACVPGFSKWRTYTPLPMTMQTPPSTRARIRNLFGTVF